MSTYRELIYMVLDQLKQMSDDSQFTEEHIMLLLDNYRALLLKQRYSDVRKSIPESNYQTLCLDVSQYQMFDDNICGNTTYLRSKEAIPNLMKIGNPKVYPTDYFKGLITYIDKERFRFVGYNKYLQNIIYCTLLPDQYLILKSNNSQFLNLEKIKVTGIFENSVDAAKYECSDNSVCDIYDKVFPLEESLIPDLITVIVKMLSAVLYQPQDQQNNAKDDLTNIPTSKD